MVDALQKKNILIQDSILVDKRVALSFTRLSSRNSLMSCEKTFIMIRKFVML